MNLTPANKKLDIRNYIQSDTVKNQLAMVLPKYLTPDRMARVATTAILKTPKLLQCKPESLLQALMLCAQAGLEPDGRNAHLIPYGDVVQVIFDYRGLIALAERNGVKNIRAMAVCENDEFQFSVENGEPKLHHVIDWKKDRGNAYAFYGTCIRSGQFDVEVMTKGEVDEIRKRSRASGSGPWVTDYDQMAKKTVLRRMSKRWDITPEAAEAIEDDSPRPKVVSTDLHALTMPDPVEEPPKTPEPPQADDGNLGPQPTKPSQENAPATTPEPPKVDPRIELTDKLSAKMAEHGVAEDVLLKYCQKNQLLRSTQKLNQLTIGRLAALVESFDVKVGEIKG